MMQLIGGEMPWALQPASLLTDSGRSSLRLLLKSKPFQQRRFLLPDFLCGTILEVFAACNVDYGFYHIKPDLTIDINSLNDSFDALYLIDYFGIRTPLPNGLAEDIAVLHDSVFLPTMPLPSKPQIWAGFNSFRKIFPAAEGSRLSASFELDQQAINHTAAPFAALKTQARHLKEEFLHGRNQAEPEYLRLFAEGEELLDRQTDIYTPSVAAITAIMDSLSTINTTQKQAQANLETVMKLLPEQIIPITPEFASFQPLRVPPAKRNELRRRLAEQQIYLPIHWPRPIPELSQPLYDEMISIPVDDRYNETDMARIANAIRSILN